MKQWAHESIFYHIYPLGFCGAPIDNDHKSEPIESLNKVNDWIDHMCSIGVNALYLGPLFESEKHGYDTVDYYTVDRRLGTNETLKTLSKNLHNKGIKLILDGVFNHVGRNFWAFQDLIKNKENSKYIDWFQNIKFNDTSPYGDPFSYEGWEGHYSLVQLNLKNPDVRQHIFKAIELWFKEFDIDGLRLDVAYLLDLDFLRELNKFCKSLKPDFWLLGETIHGDYRTWVKDDILDSVTNYECYKGLFSSHNDVNYFEIAYSLNRQFGHQIDSHDTSEKGIYKGFKLYSFAENHDVDRVASTLKNSSHLYPLYGILMTIPGIPSIYYGGEWGIEGKKENGDDSTLRPDLDLVKISQESTHKDLLEVIRKLANIRLTSDAILHGEYKQIHVAHEQFVFARQYKDECIIVAVNASQEEQNLEIDLPINNGKHLIDLINNDEEININNNKASFNLHPHWLRVLRVYY